MENLSLQNLARASKNCSDAEQIGETLQKTSDTLKAYCRLQSHILTHTSALNEVQSPAKAWPVFIVNRLCFTTYLFLL